MQTTTQTQSYSVDAVLAAAGSATPADAAVAAALSQHNLKVLLGSKSSTRQAILTEMGVVFDVVTADINEKAIRRDDPADLVMAIAVAKADALVMRFEKERARSARGDADAAAVPQKRTLLVTADQVVVHQGDVREKPESEAEARAFIASYGESPARTVGAIVVTDLDTGRRVASGDSSEVHFSPIPPEVVDFLISEGECFHCAGGLMVEHPKIYPLVTKLDGSLDSIMGLSKQVMGRLLLEAIVNRQKEGTGPHI